MPRLFSALERDEQGGNTTDAAKHALTIQSLEPSLILYSSASRVMGLIAWPIVITNEKIEYNHLTLWKIPAVSMGA